MPNYSLVVTNNLVDEFLGPPESSETTLLPLNTANQAIESPGGAAGDELARANLGMQYNTLRGVGMVHSAIQEHALESRRQMSAMIGLNAVGFETTLQALNQTRAAVELGTAATVAGFQSTSIAIDYLGQRMAASVEALRSDFNVGIGELLTLQQHSIAATQEMARAVQTPLETAARELRERGERSYQNGWFQDAYDDFTAAIQKNKFDYFAQRDLGNVILYHGGSLEIESPLRDAASHFSAACRYAEPYDKEYAAECALYEATALALQEKWKEARDRCDRACRLNPNLVEARYQRAGLKALVGDAPGAVQDLELAIQSDIRYWDRAIADGDFLANLDVSIAVAELLKTILHEYRQQYRRATLDLRELFPSPGTEHSTEAGELSILKSIDIPIDVGSPFLYQEFLARYRTLMNSASHWGWSQTLGPHGSGVSIGVSALAFSPDQQSIVSVGWDATIKLWSVETGEYLDGAGIADGTGQIHSGRTDAVAFRDSQRIITYSRQNGSLVLWNRETGQVIRDVRIPLPTVSGQRRGNAVAFSPDATILAVSLSNNSFALCAVSAAKVVHILAGHGNQVYTFAFSADNRQIASGDGLTRGVGADSEYTIKLWDLHTGDCLRTFVGAHGAVQALAFAPDGLRVASVTGSGDLRLWDAASGECLRLFEESAGETRSLCFSPDGQTLVTGGTDKNLMLWDVEEGRRVQVISEHQSAVNQVAFSADGCILASGSSDNSVRFYRRKFERHPAEDAED